jgi:hypothetical protein
MQNTGKRCVILLVFIILRWSFNYESNVFRYNKILIDCVFRNSKCVAPSTLTIDLGFASVNSQHLGDNKLAIPSYPVNKYIILVLSGFPSDSSRILILITCHLCYCLLFHFKVNWQSWSTFLKFCIQSCARVASLLSSLSIFY